MGKIQYADDDDLFVKFIREQIFAVGDDSTREGLKDTPNRVIKSWKELYSGYSQNVESILTTFSSEHYDEMVALTDIEFYSNCEHHMLPFYGYAHIGYIPSDRIVGISKLARITDIFSRRLQNQERLTQQIGQAIEKHLQPRGTIVVLEGKHFCMMSRGVQKQNSVMKTSFVSGVFKDNTELARDEFFSLIRNGKNN